MLHKKLFTNKKNHPKSAYELQYLKIIRRDTDLNHQLYYQHRFINNYDFCKHPITDITHLLIDLLLISPDLFQFSICDIENSHLNRINNNISFSTIKANHMLYRYTLYIPIELKVLQKKLDDPLSIYQGNIYLDLEKIKNTNTNGNI